MASENVLYGIDFGTSTTFLARSLPGTIAQVLPLGDEESIPSIAAYDGSEFYGGVQAVEMINAGKAVAIASPKTSITKRVFEQEVSLNGKAETIKLADAVVAILKSVIEAAGRVHKIEDLTKSLVNFGCPSSWDGEQRSLLLDCIHSAGFKKATLADIREEAIAGGLGYLDYVADRQGIALENNTVLVFDMGGGTLDVALLRATRNSSTYSVSVLASNGNDKAGDSLDYRFSSRIIGKLKDSAQAYDQENYVIGSTETTTAQALRLDARLAKEALTARDNVTISLSPVAKTKAKVALTRDELVEDFGPDLEAAFSLVENVLTLATFSDPDPFIRQDLISQGKKVEDVDKELATDKDYIRERLSLAQVRNTGLIHTAANVDTVVLVGGMSRIPVIKQTLETKFPNATVISQDKFDGATQGPEKAVVLGLATQKSPDSLNAFRPPFDVRLAWETPSGQPRDVSMFEAYSSVWDSVSSNIDFLIGHESRTAASDHPYTCAGQLSFHRPDGTAMEIEIGAPEPPHVTQTGLTGENAFNVVLTPNSPFTFKIYASGLIALRDSAGNEAIFRVDWPELWANTKAGKKSQKLAMIAVGTSAYKDRLGHLRREPIDGWRNK